MSLGQSASELQKGQSDTGSRVSTKKPASALSGGGHKARDFDRLAVERNELLRHLQAEDPGGLVHLLKTHPFAGPGRRHARQRNSDPGDRKKAPAAHHRSSAGSIAVAELKS